MLSLPSQFILWDTEYTTWEGAQEHTWSGPNEYKEIVQIGAIRATSSGFMEEGSFCGYVRPVRNPVLSDFFITLTGISQGIVDSEGETLSETLEKFAIFAKDFPLYSYGGDEGVVKENCKFLEIAMPVSFKSFRNLRPPMCPLLRERGIDEAKYSSGTLIEAFGKKVKRPAHDAVNDTRNLHDALIELQRA